MVQLQERLYLSSTQMTSLEGPSYYPWRHRERLRAKVTRQAVEVIKEADGKRVQTSGTFLALIMAKWRKSSPVAN